MQLIKESWHADALLKLLVSDLDELVKKLCAPCVGSHSSSDALSDLRCGWLICYQEGLQASNMPLLWRVHSPVPLPAARVNEDSKSM